MQELKLEEDTLREQITLLSVQQKKAYFRLEGKRIKDPDTYAVLNYFFVTGLHHFYLNKKLFGFMNLLIMLIGIVFIHTFGWVLIAIVIIIELPQLFNSQAIVQKYNNDVMRNTLAEIKSSEK